ncbi:hypothetical protein DA799_14065 [Lactiplantibacillus plantarum]|uniref:hypothetical protein n=1 Tax=Lactiplantibacillus plantarum TaxID=1590 RepID=UPI000975B328|nr:hypothetical protein [Lactiplantibacillus plantarum]MBO2713209.1 hypothetical protein [Lactiplantibacillus plantarum]PKX67082.1 hypothetical protein CUB88_01780 [Lactiplantibacillus plantarum]PTM28935.1 hypothetical protein DA799_14065 [Lactiplantibacillus plantarum]
MSKENSDLMRYTEMAMKGLMFDADTEQGFKFMTDAFLTCYEEALNKGYAPAMAMQTATMILSTMFYQD